jgi:hypothetical protein
VVTASRCSSSGGSGIDVLPRWRDRSSGTSLTTAAAWRRRSTACRGTGDGSGATTKFWLLETAGQTRPQTLRVGSNRRTDLYVEVAERTLVEVIREASESELTEGSIGADCIAVWLPLADGVIRVRYLPASPTAGYDVYTPWVLMPTVGASAPVVLSGALPTLHLGGVEVAFERVEGYATTSLPGEMRSQSRPSDP